MVLLVLAAVADGVFLPRFPVHCSMRSSFLAFIAFRSASRADGSLDVGWVAAVCRVLGRFRGDGCGLSGLGALGAVSSRGSRSRCKRENSFSSQRICCWSGFSDFGDVCVDVFLDGAASFSDFGDVCVDVLLDDCVTLRLGAGLGAAASLPLGLWLGWEIGIDRGVALILGPALDPALGAAVAAALGWGIAAAAAAMRIRDRLWANISSALRCASS